jgi:glycosyltransferase involved in cell wall biosynthesis
MNRILLCSMSVPWPTRPLLCPYHVEQARALRKLDVEMQLFSPAPQVPRWTAAVHRKCQAHLERPLRYRFRDVTVRSPRVPFFFSRWCRRHGARVAPGAVATWARLAMRRALVREIERCRPDGLLAHAIMPWGGVIRDVARRCGLPYVFIEHSAEDVLRLKRGTRLAQYYTEATRDARAVLAVGHPMVRHLRRELGLANVGFLPNGTTLPSPASDQSDARPADIRDGRLVLSAGHYYPRKGFEVLVRAFAAVGSDHPDARLRLVTNAPSGLRRLVASLGAGDRIRIVPPMSPGLLRRWMVWADLFALPSWSEAFALVGIEAMAARTPVVLSEDCGLARMITPVNRPGAADAHGWVVEPRSVESLASALDDALSDRGRLEEMGRRGHELVRERFTWDRNVRTILDAFETTSTRAAS